MANDCSGVGVGVGIFTDAVAVAHEQHPGFATVHGTQTSSGLQTGFSMQSRQACALHPARIVGQGSQWVAQYDGMPRVGTHVAAAVGVIDCVSMRAEVRGHANP